MMNPYASPQAAVRDIVDPSATMVLADRGSRLGAVLLDGVVFAGMVYLPMIAGIALGGAIGNTPDSAEGANFILAAATLFALVGFIAWGWLTIKYVKSNGQSIGKKMVNIKVVRVDGSPVSLGRLFWLRNIVNGLLSIVPLYGLVDALFIFAESRQCLHDKIADTLVIKA
jgi:uncharacterized RDD family membrane protein YckC